MQPLPQDGAQSGHLPHVRENPMHKVRTRKPTRGTRANQMVYCAETHTRPRTRPVQPNSASRITSSTCSKTPKNGSNRNDSGATTNGYRRPQKPMSSQVANKANAGRRRSPR
ncbi:hypothetical protein HPB48_013219 [Haemaphysalis longicornis]|uniref:Uncharacterized protein n=1 Tax=Haemaphysalis longicornis TaxID=44386 RepID=A0A9J6GXJ7_HAELO|nr:hypothetical protein HPB48_013219 [Haemaphysalis longicornis]